MLYTCLLPCLRGIRFAETIKNEVKIWINNYLRAGNKLGRLKDCSCEPFWIGAKQQSASGLWCLVLLPLGLMQLAVGFVQQQTHTEQLDVLSKELRLVLWTCCWYLCVMLESCASLPALQGWGRWQIRERVLAVPLLLGHRAFPNSCKLLAAALQDVTAGAASPAHTTTLKES